jgi:hypothetical protein
MQAGQILTPPMTAPAIGREYAQSMLGAPEINARLDAAFDRFMRVYACYGAHNYYGWNDYKDPRNFKGPTFWSEDDCVFRLALELEREFPHRIHLELPVARWSFADFDRTTDKQERVDLVVSDLHDFVEDDTSQQRFMTRQHELFVEGKFFPFGCARRWRFDHVRKIPSIVADANRLARHLARGHCLVAAVLVVDDEDLFEYDQPSPWPESVRLLLASPRELERRGIERAAAKV